MSSLLFECLAARRHHEEKGWEKDVLVASWLEAALVLVLVLKMAEVRAAAGPWSRCWGQDTTQDKLSTRGYHRNCHPELNSNANFSRLMRLYWSSRSCTSCRLYGV
jgi:hypothetical protein